MKKIIKLTESDLVRILRRVISEDSKFDGVVYSSEECYKKVPSQYKQIINMFDKATQGFDDGVFTNWDENMLKNAILSIKSPQEYKAVNKQLECFVLSQAHDPTEGLNTIIPISLNGDVIRFYVKLAFGSETSFIPSESQNKKIILQHIKQLGV
jgi:hypothetical protein